MKEELLHFIWKYKLLRPGRLLTASGATLKILQTGELNTDSGPDFFNAKLEVGNLTLAGNIEIHVRSSDWLKHGHQHDALYDNIILHVVYRHDVSLEQNKAFNVEVLELKNYIHDDVIRTYEQLLASKTMLCCSGQIGSIPEIKIQSWLQRMLTERLETKTTYVKQLFALSKNDYTQTLYLLLARNFGFKINAEPFELLAKQLPLAILLKHKDNLFQLEALLFGTAGLLNEQFRHKYPQQLQNEFEFLKAKFKLAPLDKTVWKFMRLRPANFPTMRLWQFAMLLYKSPGLFTDPVRYADAETLYKAISHHHPGYWQNHYTMDGEESKTISRIGESSVQNILINTMAPYLFFYGKKTHAAQHSEAAIHCFDELPFENNKKTRLYIKAGLKLKTAAESQGLIHLHDNYCKARQCLRCAVAASLLLNAEKAKKT